MILWKRIGKKKSLGKEKIVRVRFLPQFWQKIVLRLCLECSLTTTERHFLFCLDVQKKWWLLTCRWIQLVSSKNTSLRACRVMAIYL